MLGSLGQILIADAEEAWFKATADLLAGQGYVCDGAPSGPAAAAMIAAKRYDLLIADADLPERPGLDLVRDMVRQQQVIPVILVAAQLSLETATQSIRLPVVAYLAKAADPAELLTSASAAIEQARLMHVARDATQQLEAVRQGMQAACHAVLKTSAGGASADALVSLALCNIAGSLLDIRRVLDVRQGRPAAASVCQHFNCSREQVLSQAIRDTVAVLQQTRHAFKSKELAELRKRLEQFLMEPRSPR